MVNFVDLSGTEKAKDGLPTDSLDLETKQLAKIARDFQALVDFGSSLQEGQLKKATEAAEMSEAVLDTKIDRLADALLKRIENNLEGVDLETAGKVLVDLYKARKGTGKGPTVSVGVGVGLGISGEPKALHPTADVSTLKAVGKIAEAVDVFREENLKERKAIDVEVIETSSNPV